MGDGINQVLQLPGLPGTEGLSGRGVLSAMPSEAVGVLIGVYIQRPVRLLVTTMCLRKANTSSAPRVRCHKTSRILFAQSQYIPIDTGIWEIIGDK